VHNQQAKSYHPNQAPVWVPHSSQPHRDEWANRVTDPLSSPRPTYIAILILILATTLTTQAQWDIEDSHTTASLRGIHNVGGGVAWASGTEGTVLRTEDGGYLWQTCATPPGAEKLDFRGIQAFDENTAIVMSSGKGDLSRLYKTTDGGRTWKLLFTNPDKEGFWDAVYVRPGFDGWKAPQGTGASPNVGILIGDPVDGRFALFRSENNLLNRWFRMTSLDRAPSLRFPTPHTTSESLFAASNSILMGDETSTLRFVTGGDKGAYFYSTKWHLHALFDYATASFMTKRLPLTSGVSAGAFSFAADHDCNLRPVCSLVVVGGDYKKPDDPIGTSARSNDDGDHWTAAQTPPHGYRSAVAYDPTTKTWITVGPNGTDISHDDGRNWSPLKPTPAEPQDADKNWNALSLPFVVGPKGHIGKLRDNAIPTEASSKETKAKKD
jgi:hypothetical protein